jgi:di/tricarboxylate transporter
MILYPIWILFAAIFFAFAYQHWRMTQSLARTFRLREVEGNEVLADFVGDFNQYIDSTNAILRSQHRTAMVGYFVAGLLALVSMFFSLA